MPHEFFLDLLRRKRVAVKKDVTIPIDKKLANQKFVDYDMLMQKLMVAKPWSELVPLQDFTNKHTYVATLLNSYSGMAFEQVLQDLIEECKHKLTEVKNVDAAGEDLLEEDKSELSDFGR